MHGTFGEDGSLQELLETKKIPFVGSGSAASRKAIDKNASNKLFSEHGLSIPQSQILIKDDSISLNFPIVVKPHNEGSSISLYKCQTLDEFETMREKIFSIHTKMLAQEFVSGREFTCGILDIKDSPTALPATEIILKNTALFDYKAKYTSWECTEITPAEVSREIMREIQDIALQCHSILGCKSLSRTDMILKESGIIYVLETNTMPGMTKTSFVPAQAKAYGLDMKQLVTCLLESVSAD